MGSYRSHLSPTTSHGSTNDGTDHGSTNNYASTNDSTDHGSTNNTAVSAYHCTKPVSIRR